MEKHEKPTGNGGWGKRERVGRHTRMYVHMLVCTYVPYQSYLIVYMHESSFSYLKRIIRDKSIFMYFSVTIHN